MNVSESNIAFKEILETKEAFCEVQPDTGASTRWGISLRFLRSLPAETLRTAGIFESPESLQLEHLKELTDDQIHWIYMLGVWDCPQP
jgi:hypothetical protein